MPKKNAQPEQLLPETLNPCAIAVEALALAEQAITEWAPFSAEDQARRNYCRSAAASLLVLAETQQAMLKELKQLRAMVGKRGAL